MSVLAPNSVILVGTPWSCSSSCLAKLYRSGSATHMHPVECNSHISLSCSFKYRPAFGLQAVVKTDIAIIFTDFAI